MADRLTFRCRSPGEWVATLDGKFNAPGWCKDDAVHHLYLWMNDNQFEAFAAAASVFIEYFRDSDQPPFDRLLSDLWVEEFSPHGLCCLCGNSGIIDTTGAIFSPAGVPCGARVHCICPNGRNMKQTGRDKPSAHFVKVAAPGTKIDPTEGMD